MNRIHKVVEISLFHFFTKKPAATHLNVQISSTTKYCSHLKEVTTTSYEEAGNYLVETCTKDKVIAETNKEIKNRTHQPLNKMRPEYAMVLWSEALCCGRKYEEYAL